MQRPPAIQELCARLDRGTLGRSDFADSAASLVASQVGSSAAALWLLVDTRAGRRAQPLGLGFSGTHWGLALDPPCPRFIASLKCEGSVVAHDARQHGATQAFFDPALPRSPVRSMLAVPFSVNNDLFGALVCAHFDQTTRWSAVQLSALRRIGIGICPPLARATSFAMSARPRELPGVPWALHRSAPGHLERGGPFESTGTPAP